MFVCVWGRPDVSVIISSVNINMTFLALKSLPCPEIISHSQSASNKQIQGFSSCRQFARQSRHESWNKFSSWMDFLCSKRIYGWVRTRSHTGKKKKKTQERDMQGALWRGSEFAVVESMDTIHCQDALDSPHTDSWKSRDFDSLAGVKLLQSNMLSTTWKWVVVFFGFFVSSHTTPWLITSHFFVIHLTIAAGKSYCCQFGFVNVRSQCWFPKRSSILKMCALVALWNTSAKIVHQRVNGTFHCFL